MPDQEDINRAKAIISAAKEFDIYEAAMPTDDKKLVEDAEELVEQAKTADKAGAKGPAVTAVLFVSQMTPVEQPEEDFPDITKMTVKQAVNLLNVLKSTGNEKDIERLLLEETNDHGGRPTIRKWEEDNISKEVELPRPEEEIADAVQDDEEAREELAQELENKLEKPTTKFTKEYDDEFRAKEEALAKVRKDRLPVPEQYEGDPPVIPNNIVSAPLSKLQELARDITACLSLATWRTALAQIDEEYAERVGDHYYRLSLVQASSHSDKRTKDVVIAEAESDPKVEEWREKENSAHNEFLTYRALKEIYKGQYDTVSRIFSMRQEERDRT